MATKTCFSKIQPKIVLAVDPTWVRIKEDTTTDNTENLNVPKIVSQKQNKIPTNNKINDLSTV